MVKQSQRVSGHAKAGLVFPIRRVHRYLKNAVCTGRISRVGDGAAVYTAAVLEYLVAEVVELAGTAARDNKHKIIRPRHLQLAILNDTELSVLIKNSISPDGGVIPRIHDSLLPAAARAKAQAKAMAKAGPRAADQVKGTTAAAASSHDAGEEAGAGGQKGQAGKQRRYKKQTSASQTAEAAVVDGGPQAKGTDEGEEESGAGEVEQVKVKDKVKVEGRGKRGGKGK